MPRLASHPYTWCSKGSVTSTEEHPMYSSHISGELAKERAEVFHSAAERHQSSGPLVHGHGRVAYVRGVARALLGRSHPVADAMPRLRNHPVPCP